MEFKINNKNWKIVEATQQEIKEEMKTHFDKPDDEGKYVGITYSDMQIIMIDKDLHEEQKRTTLIHELMHCYLENYVTHMISKSYSTEDLCDIVSYSHDIIREIVDKYFQKVK